MDLSSIEKYHGKNRLVHAVSVCDKGNTDYENIYSRVGKFNITFNVLLSYFYIIEKAKNLDDTIKLLTNWRRLCTGKLLIDSGIFTLMTKKGVTFGGNPNEHHLIQNSSYSQEISEYTLKYVDFLNNTRELWDYAIDMDADLLLPVDYVDRLHIKTLELAKFRSEKMIRVYHSVRENVNEWWERLCKNHDYEWVGIESIGHRWNPQFYKPLISIAHSQGKKVHILAASSKRFFERVEMDSADSSSHLNGGRNMSIFSPWGEIHFGTYDDSRKHYSHLGCKERDILMDKLYEAGFTWEDMFIRENRILYNIWYMSKHWDVPYVETPQSLRLF